MSLLRVEGTRVLANGAGGEYALVSLRLQGDAAVLVRVAELQVYCCFL